MIGTSLINFCFRLARLSAFQYLMVLMNVNGKVIQKSGILPLNIPSEHVKVGKKG